MSPEPDDRSSSALAAITRKYLVLKRLTLAICGLLLAALVAGWAHSPQDDGELKARRITIQDEKGRTRLSFGPTPIGYGVLLHHEDGTPRFIVSSDEVGKASLYMLGSRPDSGFNLTISEDGAPHLVLQNAGSMADIGFNSGGMPFLALRDTQNFLRMLVALEEEGGLTFHAYDARGETRYRASVSPEGEYAGGPIMAPRGEIPDLKEPPINRPLEVKSQP